jgi:hypothetical protein
LTIILHGSTSQKTILNDELYSLYKDLDIVIVIKAARVRWLGYLVGMKENSPSKKITFSQPEGCRKKGRPKLRWIDIVLKDVTLLKVEAWWKKNLIVMSGGWSSRRPRSIKGCRATGGEEMRLLYTQLSGARNYTL